MPPLQEVTIDGTKLLQRAPVPGETLAAIAAAAAVFLGRQVRILAIEQISAQGEKANRWSRQGRVLVQSSHNLALKHPQKAR